MDRSVILIGFMGVGKDTIGKKLARRTNRVFISTDRLIELRCNKNITRIFKEHGEMFFRKQENEVLSIVTALPNSIIATGGGIIGQKENLVLLNETAEVIHLSAPLSTIQERLSACSHRPLAHNQEQLTALYNQRAGMYDFAGLCYDTAQYTSDEVVDRIIKDLNIHSMTSMIQEQHVHVTVPGTSYPVRCGYSMCQGHNPFHGVIHKNDAVCIVTNPLVGSLYLDPIECMLKDIGVKTDSIIVPDGEQFKTMDTAMDMYDRLLDKRFPRSGIILGLGGGVISDLSGFVSATYKRGVRCMFLPTTLLAQVDAAIGGKNGVNHACGKNMIGTFYQPVCVLNDIHMLNTLPEKEYRNGIAEMIKYGVIQDNDLFTFLEDHHKEVVERDPETLVKLIARCADIKAQIVSEDEKELRGLRHILNFGHTIGHVIETHDQYTGMTHGEAVAIGMVIEAYSAVRHKKLAQSDFSRLKNLISMYSLPNRLPDRLVG